MSAQTYTDAAVPGCAVCSRHIGNVRSSEKAVVNAARYRASASTLSAEARRGTALAKAKAYLVVQCEHMSDHLRTEHDLSPVVAA